MINRWKSVKMTSDKFNGMYTTNLCPVCDAESIAQTNACSRCGTVLKGANRKDACENCVHSHCEQECHKCGHTAGDKHRCKCIITDVNEPCPFYEEDTDEQIY